MEILSFLKDYAIIIIPFCMWFSAQILKFIIYSVKHGVDWRYLFEYGHMPSSHTACMTGLVVATGYYEGLDSAIFAVAFTIGLITIYDALKFRTYIGDYGRAINLFLKDAKERKYPRLKEHVGHTIQEVLSGAAWGVFGSFIIIKIFNIFA